MIYPIRLRMKKGWTPGNENDNGEESYKKRTEKCIDKDLEGKSISGKKR